MLAHIISLRWDDKVPKFSIRAEGKDEIKLKVGNQINIKKTGKRKCIGYFHGGSYRKCPLDRTVEGSSQCFYCKNLDSFRPCLTCNGEECKANPRRRRNCLEKEHAVYLASFGKIVKVGVTRLGRVWERWIEQGADYGVILEKVNGKEARKIESGFSGIRDRVYFEEKVKELGNPKKEVLKKKIREKNLEPETKIYPVHKKYPGKEAFKNVKISEEFENGIIKSIKGPTLIYENGKDLKAYNLKKLIAEFVEI